MTDALSGEQIERMGRAIPEKSGVAPEETPGGDPVKSTPVPSPAPAGSMQEVVIPARELLAEEKRRIRIRAREVLGVLSLPERARRSALICGNIGNHPLYREAERVFLYRALPDEPNLRMLEEDSRPLFFPVIQDRGSLSMRFFPRGDDLFRPGAFGIEEPASSSTPQIPTAADVMLIPGRAFTTGGLRLGRGGGFYDRYLSGLDPADFPILIGVGFREQLFPSLPAGARDFPMHVVITDRIDHR